MTGARLHSIEAGSAHAPVLVLLHGFGGHAAGWQPVMNLIGNHFCILAPDLPGHAGSLDYPGFGSPRTAALAVLEELDRRAIPVAHVAGHSMGGAVAALMALERPECIASLTLVAPGGFGPQMDQPALRTFAGAKTVAELARAMKPMFAAGFVPDRSMLDNLAAMRSRPGQAEALDHVLAKISRGGGQSVLPLEKLAAGRFPVTLLWGTADRTVPFSQSSQAPSRFNLTAIRNAGHMLPDEAPQAVARAIVEQSQAV